MIYAMAEETFNMFEAGPSACPFVAYEDDRDHRSNVPDYRHRCFAASEPEPRAFPHQERYCLSSEFAGCPIFLDWARQEAAGVLQPGRPSTSATVTRDPSPAAVIAAAAAPEAVRESEAPAFLAGRPRTATAPDGTVRRTPDPAGGLWGYEGETRRPNGPSAPVPPSSVSPPSIPMARRGPSHPGWETPPREDHFPRLRSRDDRRANQPLLLGMIAVSIVVVFLIVGPLVFGQKSSPGSGPTGSVAPTVDATPTPVSSPTKPTFLVYHVKANDSMAKIANTFNLQLFEIEDANPQITDFNHIEIGELVYIPPSGFFTPAPTPGKT
jgi:hypothetical protein